MTTLFGILMVQAFLGPADNVINHEWKLRLPARRSAAREMGLHAARQFAYGILLGGLAWFEWHGSWAAAMAALLVMELGITIADFLEEDRTRAPLPPAERVLHTVLTVLFGAFLALIAPVLLNWWALPTALAPAYYAGVTPLFTLCAAGVVLWGIRDTTAALKGARAPAWWRKPYYMGRPNGAGAVAVTGATGFIGRHLVRQLLANGDAVIVKTTNAENAQDLFGRYVTVVTAMTAIPATTPVRAVVNVAGAPIMPIPWTTARRATLMASRVQTTQAIVDWIKGRAQKPAVLVGVSGIGFSGAMPNDREVDERKITRLKSNARALDEHHGDGGHGDRGHGDRGRTGDRQHNDHAMRGRDFQAQLCDGCRAGRLGAGSGNATTGALDANSGPAVGA